MAVQGMMVSAEEMSALYTRKEKERQASGQGALARALRKRFI